MDMPAGIAASLDRLAAIVGSCATAARGVRDAHGRSEACQASRSPDVVACPEAMQDIHPSSDLRA